MPSQIPHTTTSSSRRFPRHRYLMGHFMRAAARFSLTTWVTIVIESWKVPSVSCLDLASPFGFGPTLFGSFFGVEIIALSSEKRLNSVQGHGEKQLRGALGGSSMWLHPNQETEQHARRELRKRVDFLNGHGFPPYALTGGILNVGVLLVK